MSIKWNKVEMSNQILDELVIFYNLRSFIYRPSNFYFTEAGITTNRPAIFQVFLNEFPNIIDRYITSRSLYYLYNFKNKVNILKLIFVALA